MYSVVGRGKSQRKARTANQLILTSSVAKKRRPANQDREYIERHWLGKKNGSNRVFTNPEYRGMMGKHRDLTILSDHVAY